MLLWFKLLLLTLVLFVNSCGLSYQYGGMLSAKNKVYVDYIEGIEGNILRNRLADYFSADVTKDSKYVIRSNVTINTVNSNTDSEGFATSKMVYVYAHWQLYDIETGDIIYEDVSNSFSKYSFRDLNYLNNQDEVSSIDASILVIAKKIFDSVSLVLVNMEEQEE